MVMVGHAVAGVVHHADGALAPGSRASLLLGMVWLGMAVGRVSTGKTFTRLRACLRARPFPASELAFRSKFVLVPDGYPPGIWHPRASTRIQLHRVATS